MDAEEEDQRAVNMSESLSHFAPKEAEIEQVRVLFENVSPEVQEDWEGRPEFATEALADSLGRELRSAEEYAVRWVVRFFGIRRAEMSARLLRRRARIGSEALRYYRQTGKVPPLVSDTLAGDGLPVPAMYAFDVIRHWDNLGAERRDGLKKTELYAAVFSKSGAADYRRKSIDRAMASWERKTERGKEAKRPEGEPREEAERADEASLSTPVANETTEQRAALEQYMARLRRYAMAQLPQAGTDEE